MDILIWLSLATPIVLIAYLLFRIGKRIWTWFHPEDEQPKEDPPAPLTEMSIVQEPLKCPEFTAVEQEGWRATGEDWDPSVIDCRKLVDPGTRVWRTYRSADGIHWSECEPALTERAACNYASYIKRSNPEEFVRCNDPNGVILFYE